ncbi:hypothetical protein [Nonomuraea sp. NPDC003727]
MPLGCSPSREAAPPGQLIAAIPVIILFALVERKVVGGLTAGSIR